jgi:hypothetical protein
MEKHVRAAVDKYPDTAKQNLIHPVSEIDAQIMVEIMELLKKMEFTAAIDILKEWKRKSDQDIALDLLDLNTSIARDQGSKPAQDNNAPQFIVTDRYYTVCKRRIDLWLIIGYDSVDEEIDDEMKYFILLNPTPKLVKSVPFYSNEVLEFKTEKERDESLSVFDGYFAKYKGLFI